MAVIAIFCDGTWNSPRAAAPTHVERLSRLCAKSEAQSVLYFPGVGSATRQKSFIGKGLDRFGGGAFGWGLNRNIKEAYLELCKVYRPGDKIMIFGFSRGAYTARSLAGMIRKCGILADTSDKNLTDAFELYRARGDENGPDEEHIKIRRRALSPDVATSPDDVMWRNDGSTLVRITYLGIWDTVGALGIPPSVLGPVATLWNKRYAFHDTNLTSLVEQARHAVALDEKRVVFKPTLWGNLAQSEDGPGLNKGDTSADRPYQQVWFSGVHSTIGGSVAGQGLAGATLDWVFEGAAKLGLTLRHGATVPVEPIEPAAAAPELGVYNRVYKLTPWLLQWRDGPKVRRDLHPSVTQRLEARNDYQPGSLSHLP